MSKSRSKKILCIVGTRPEAIKMAPVIHAFKCDPLIDVTVLSVGQHKEMLDQMLNHFEIQPDRDLAIMQDKQTLPEITAALPLPLDQALGEICPDIVFAQGDTTSAFMSGLACFYRRIPFAHVEAGLRSGSHREPFPEELNRTLISKLTHLHFAPTKIAEQNLLNEGISSKHIYVVGNPVIDALLQILEKKPSLDPRIDPSKKLILVTAHRRENWDRLSHICQAVNQIVLAHRDVQVLFSVHLNPLVSECINSHCAGNPQIILSAPLDYPPFIAAMHHATLVLSDSGGVQEEGPAVNTPVIVFREKTERPEAITAGANLLVPCQQAEIFQAADLLLTDEGLRKSMTQKGSLYGDGKASVHILAKTKKFLGF